MDRHPVTVLDVVIPVHDEEASLEASVRRLHSHLLATFPYPSRITIADNASTDRTWEVATRLAREVAGVVAVRMPEKGRGRALRQVWLESDAAVLAYMDVDLSTDLDALWPLVAPLMSGHSDLAIGTRLHHSSRVVRGPRREVLSRGYNQLLRVVLGTRFSDAQCGFKAIRGDVARELLPLVEDDTWFFDTELLVLAERCGLRIHEVPVDWWDDPDSRVDIVATAADDLRGVWRMRTTHPRGSAVVADIAARMGRTRPTEGVGAQVLTFLWVGAVSWCLQLVLYVAFRSFAAAQVANVAALLLATVANTWANGRWTFGETRADGIRRQQAQGLAIVAATWALTAAALALLHLGWPESPAVVETAVVGAATVLATAAKFVAMRRWVFRPAPAPGAGDDPGSEPALPGDARAGYPVGASGGVA